MTFSCDSTSSSSFTVDELRCEELIFVLGLSHLDCKSLEGRVILRTLHNAWHVRGRDSKLCEE